MGEAQSRGAADEAGGEGGLSVNLTDTGQPSSGCFSFTLKMFHFEIILNSRKRG